MTGSFIATDAGLNSPRDFVLSGWNYQRDLGNTWREYVIESLANFSAIQPAPISFEVPVDLTVDYGTFIVPTPPTRPTFSDVSVTLPTAPVLADVAAPAVTDAPVEPDFGALTYSKPAAPNTAMPVRPDLAEPTLIQIVVPDAPALPDIEDPTLYDIVLPDVPTFTVPTFDAVRPVRDFTVPVQTFAWQAVAYDNTMIDSVKSRLSDMTINGLGLPADVEQALFDRQRNREDALTLQATQDASDTLASRGLRQPQGLLTRTLDRIRTESRQRTSGANRDLTIRMAELAVEGVKFALSQAITLEVALVQVNVQNNELALKGASAAQQFAIDLFNTRVALFNADMEGFKTDAAVFESRIRALDSQVNLYKSQVDAQKVIGDVNESLVRSLSERLRARGVLIDLYRANVEAARAKGEINTQLLEQERLRLQTFQADVEAWSTQQQGYKISVDAELGNVQALEALGNVYGRRVETWATKNKLYFDQGRFQIEAQIQQLEKYKALLQGANIDAQTQIAVRDSQTRVYGADVAAYGTQGQIAGLQAAQADRQASLRVETARLRIETAQKSAELTANYAIKVIDEQIEVLKAKAQIVAQLAASSQSGVNFGASYSGSIGIGMSASHSVSWSGDAPDLATGSGNYVPNF